jgi:hypothetical protein
MAYAADIGDEFTDLLADVINVGAKVVIFLVILALGWFVASWVRRWVSRLLHRAGFDRVTERGGLSRMLGSNSASDLAARLIQFALLIFVLQIAFGVFGPNPVSELIQSVVAWLPKLLVAVVIVVVAAAIAGWVKDVIRTALGGLSYAGSVATAVQVLILALGIMAALNQIGVGTTVTLPVLITVLATVGGILIVGVGGGLIRPMQQRWERMLTRAEAETSSAAGRIRARRDATAGGATAADRKAPDAGPVPPPTRPARAAETTEEIRPPGGR